MPPIPPDLLPLLIGAALTGPLALLWIGVHIVGVVRLGGGLAAASPRIKQAWLLSVVAGFLGPCVIPASLIAVAMALSARRATATTPETQRVARTILLSGALILLMTTLLGLAVIAQQLQTAP